VENGIAASPISGDVVHRPGGVYSGFSGHIACGCSG
jgi:hypothetical protein